MIRSVTLEDIDRARSLLEDKVNTADTISNKISAYNDFITTMEQYARILERKERFDKKISDTRSIMRKARRESSIV